MNIQEVKRKVDVGYMDEKELYSILDWLIKEAEKVEVLERQLENAIFIETYGEPEPKRTFKL